MKEKSKLSDDVQVALDIGALARKHGKAAIKVLVAILKGDGPAAPRLLAAKVLLDRGWGKVGGGPASRDGGAPPLACIKRVIVFPEQHEQDSKSREQTPAQSETDSQD